MAKRPVKNTSRKIRLQGSWYSNKSGADSAQREPKKVSDEIYIPHYLANIENKGQYPSLQTFFELMLCYNISVDQFLLDIPLKKIRSGSSLRYGRI